MPDLHQSSRPYFCEAWIHTPADPWASTYCKLPAGHSGPHSAHYPNTSAWSRSETSPPTSGPMHGEDQSA